ncbi:MAG: exosome complex RNA-binding protein Csl4 [Candidatus Altiarchaeota archaeon]|nr:exosome complex RNA-binding protein Csl4 [Candidatus Altiarchaeota archaeon]
MEDKVMIGDYLGTIEEFMPGSGTFEEDGKIYAAKMGIKYVDAAKHIAEVHGKDLPRIKIGQTVFAQVNMIKNSNVIVEIGRIKGVNNPVSERAMIYVSNIDEKYVKDPSEMFAIGDIVKAKVLKMGDDLIDLTTKEPDLGVVKAFSKETRYPLVKSAKYPDKLEDPVTKAFEKRKISSEYGCLSEI